MLIDTYWTRWITKLPKFRLVLSHVAHLSSFISIEESFSKCRNADNQKLYPRLLTILFGGFNYLDNHSSIFCWCVFCLKITTNMKQMPSKWNVCFPLITAMHIIRINYMLLYKTEHLFLWWFRCITGSWISDVNQWNYSKEMRYYKTENYIIST